MLKTMPLILHSLHSATLAMFVMLAVSVKTKQTILDDTYKAL